jgi:hypothetical protein
MTDPQWDRPAQGASRLSPRTFLMHEWPYLAMLGLALFGVAYTSLAQRPLTMYWMTLTPFIGTICVLARWRDVEGQKEHLRLIWTQALHWGAVLVAMNLLFVADVKHMMNADASALSMLILLALGTFTAGVHVAAWRICLVGVVLGIGVPAIAWLEQSTLLILLAVVVLVAIAILYLLKDPTEGDKRKAPT